MADNSIEVIPGLPVEGSPTVGARKALSIALRYDDAHKRHPEEIETLQSTYADIDHVRRLLVAFGYKENDIVTLKDDGSTKLYPDRQTILEAMRQLVDGARPGDRFVFHFSGHGSQQDALKDLKEKDGKDEVIWPADVAINAKEKVFNIIVDDDIRSILVDGLPEHTRLVMIFDCCHSGTAADLEHCHSDHIAIKSLRELTSFVQDGATTQPVPTVYSFPPSSCIDSDSPPDTARQDAYIHEEYIETRRIISWSACRDMEIEYGTSFGGLFLHIFVEVVLKSMECNLNYRGYFQGDFVDVRCHSSCPHGAGVSHERILHEVLRRMHERTATFNRIVHKFNKQRRIRLGEGQVLKFFTCPRPMLGSVHDYTQAKGGYLNAAPT